MTGPLCHDDSNRHRRNALLNRHSRVRRDRIRRMGYWGNQGWGNDRWGKSDNSWGSKWGSNKYDSGSSWGNSWGQNSGSKGQSSLGDISDSNFDMLYTGTGFKFKFNFEFEWELLPGLPGETLDSDWSNEMGAYGQPEQTAYGVHLKPTYAPTYKPTYKPTYRPTYKPTYKPTITPSHSPPQPPSTYKTTTISTTEESTTEPHTSGTSTPSTTEPVTSGTSTPSTTETVTTTPYVPSTTSSSTTVTSTTYKTTTSATKTTTTYKTTTTEAQTTTTPKCTPSPSPGEPCVDPPVPNQNCPWNPGSKGDCPSHPGTCNLKFFNVCGLSHFKKIYCDACLWLESLQLVPMITNKLVPLGLQYEKTFGKCTGFGAKSFQELLITAETQSDSERDIPKCKPIAGAVPCDLVDFSNIATPGDFAIKMEKLADLHLRLHCNDEFMVHFDALTLRLRNSLTCEGGLQPDHMLPSDSPNWDNLDYCEQDPIEWIEPDFYSDTLNIWVNYEKPVATDAPFKPQKEYFTVGPTQPVITPTDTTPKPTCPPRPVHPGTPCVEPPAPNHDCPWRPDTTGDCSNHPGRCNLKFFNVCGLAYFKKIYCNACQWLEPLQLMPMITEKLAPLGLQYEKTFGRCVGFGKEKSIQELLITDEKSNVSNMSIRDVAFCNPIAGAAPCHLLDFSGVHTAEAFALKIEALANRHLRKHCNPEFMVHFDALTQRLRNSLTCEGGLQPDHILPDTSPHFHNMPDGCTQPPLEKPWKQPSYYDNQGLAIYTGFPEKDPYIEPTTLAWTTLDTTTVTTTSTTTSTMTTSTTVSGYTTTTTTMPTTSTTNPTTPYPDDSYTTVGETTSSIFSTTTTTTSTTTTTTTTSTTTSTTYSTTTSTTTTTTSTTTTTTTTSTSTVHSTTTTEASFTHPPGGTPCHEPPKPQQSCPWKAPINIENGDCPRKKGRCNLKYFRVCGLHFYKVLYLTS